MNKQEALNKIDELNDYIASLPEGEETLVECFEDMSNYHEWKCDNFVTLKQLENNWIEFSPCGELFNGTKYRFFSSKLKNHSFIRRVQKVE